MYQEMLNYVKECLETTDINATQLKEKFPFRNRYKHIVRVCKWAERINKVEKGNEKVVKVAAIFHDAGKSINGGINHAEEGSKICRKYLLDRSYDKAFIEKVAKTVKMHSSKKAPVSSLTLEERIIIDADLLDELGAMTVLWDSMATGAEKEQSYEIAYYRILKAFKKAKENLKYLKTEEGKRLYKDRLDFLELYIKNLEYELGV